MVVCRAKDNQKIQKNFYNQVYPYRTIGVVHASVPFHETLSRHAQRGAIATAETLFFDPADAVSDPKKVRIWGNPTRFSLFFLTPQMQSLTLKRYVFWGIQLAFPCFLSEKRGEGELFVR